LYILFYKVLRGRDSRTLLVGCKVLSVACMSEVATETLYTFVNVLGVGVMLLLVGYHYVVTSPKSDVHTA